MNDIVHVIDEVFSSNMIRYAVLDKLEMEIRVLINSDDRNSACSALKSSGWTEQKDTSGDIYLYGMDHFKYFNKNGWNLIICCQLACRSTLNGEWVPLDRKINNSALSDAKETNSCLVILQPEDMLCYLLAKGVYTDDGFTLTDICRINSCLKEFDQTVLMPKLEGVFFRFSDKILSMAQNNEFEQIKTSLWAFSDY